MDYSFLHEKNVPENSSVEHSSKFKFSLIIVFLFLFSAVFGANMDIFVSSDGSGDGTSSSSPTTFQLALDQAHNNADTVFIKLLEGTYDASTQTLSYILATGEIENLVIQGGFNSGGDYSLDPELTILDGGGLKQILNLNTQAENGVLKIFISNISFINGFASDDGNAETIDHGGAIMAYAGSSEVHSSFYLELNNCYFINNKTASGYNGGAIYSNAWFKISGCEFVANEGGSGGAIFAYPDPMGDSNRICTIDNSNFRENKNTGNQGSTIWHALELEITDCEFLGIEDGVSVGNGSCIWGNSYSISKLSRCLFKDITIKYWGSAFQTFGGSAYIDNCIFINNKAGEGGDGYGTLAFYHNNLAATTKRITNCTFDGNRSKLPTAIGGAIHNRGKSGDDFVVANCIFSDNGSSPVFSYANIAFIKNSISTDAFLGINDGGGNLSGDPLYSDMYKHLSENSPCINTGTNSAEPEMDTDFDGNRRILSEIIDMGAHEYNHKPDSIRVSDTLLSENSGADYALGTLSAKDLDIEDMDDLKFSLVPGDGVNDVDNDKFKIVDNTLITLENANFEEHTVWYIYVKVTDFSGLSEEASFEISIKNENDPVIANAIISDQSVIVGEAYEFTFDEDLFTDQDTDDEIIYTASLEDESDLPAWLSFNDLTRSFSGTPAATDRDSLDIIIIASDNNGSSVSVSFNLVVKFNTSVEDFIKENILIFPNPATDRIVINIPDEYIGQDLRIYNLNGVLIKKLSKNYKNQIEVEVSNLPSGMYYMLLGNDIVLKAKFVVQ